MSGHLIPVLARTFSQSPRSATPGHGLPHVGRAGEMICLYPPLHIVCEAAVMARARSGDDFNEGDTVVVEVDAGEVTGVAEELDDDYVLIRENGTDQEYRIDVRQVLLPL
jgi:hypothetical protein